MPTLASMAGDISGQAMNYIQPKLSPGKGRFPKSPKKRAMRRYLLAAGGAYKQAGMREGGFQRSRGAASECRTIDPSSPEGQAIMAKLSKAKP
jgi:hypothetical protein